MRALLRIHTSIMGRIPSQGSCQAFGFLLPLQNRHFVRRNVGWWSTEKHKADLVLDVRFEPTTYPAGCDKDDYRRYFKRGKVYILGAPLNDRLGNLVETIRGLRPDAVVLMPLPPNTIEIVDREPEFVERVFPREIALAYREARALPHCTVVGDGQLIVQTASITDNKKRANELIKKLSGGLSESEKLKTTLEARKLMSEMQRSIALEQKVQRLFRTYILQRTLNERTSEKYTRLRASEKDKLEPVRMVTLTDVGDLDGIEENWQRPVDEEQVEEALKENRSSGRLNKKIIAAVALLCIVYTLTRLPEPSLRSRSRSLDSYAGETRNRKDFE